ncbi:MAG: M20/M25/M40 family metallo-hydrolase [Halieaceae bacterium]|nr:M20/M25/M40 family metallo-hydrolase [Halieaceae bacterium]
MLSTTNPLARLARATLVTAAVCLSLNSAAQDELASQVASTRKAVDEYRSQHEAEILTDFADLLAIPNVAVDLANMEVNADHIIGLLESRGFSSRKLHAGGAPYIYAELNAPGATETVLIYAHFDGQPVQEENWAYPAFSPTLLDGPLPDGKPVDIDKVTGPFGPEWRLYARSAGDDKMPVIALVHTLDALAAAGIDRSVNIKLLLDGEEEMGSPTVREIIDKHGKLLQADVLLFCDGPMHQSRRTQIVFGVRGSTTVDLTTYGATRPLHSGHYGNWSPNPIMEMAYLLTSMRDESGRILVKDYYSNVTPLSELEQEAIAGMPDVTETLKDELSVHTPEGDGARLEELIALPALNVRGFVAGGVGNKGRNVLLSTATASIDLRLVPDQTPESTRKLLEDHMAAQGYHVVSEDPTPEILRAHPRVVKMDWKDSGYPALRTKLDNPMALRLTGLMRAISPDLIVTPTMGGSLPLHEFGTRLSAPIIILPLANHDNNQHAENENIRLQNLWDAMAVYGAVLAHFGDQDHR